MVLLFSFFARSQNEYKSKFMRFYVPDCMGSPFPVPADTYIAISENGQMFLKIHVNFTHNAEEFSYFQKYAIPKGNNFYLKLDNGDIITLICSLDKTVEDDYVIVRDDIYQNYAEYSYFPIDADMVDKLKNYNIVKVRGQFKFEVMDGSMQFTPDSGMPKTKDAFIQAEQDVLGKYNAAKSESEAQDILKKDPLYNF